MEAMLLQLNDDDSSSGESGNNEVAKVTVPPSASAAAGVPPIAVVAAAGPPQTTTARPAAGMTDNPAIPTATNTAAGAAPPAAATQPTGGAGTTAMLRNLYQSRNKPQTTTPAAASQRQPPPPTHTAPPDGASGASLPQANVPSSRTHRPQQIPGQQQQQYSHQQVLQSQNKGRGISSAASNRPSHHHHHHHQQPTLQPQQGRQQQQQQQQQTRPPQQYTQQHSVGSGTGGLHYGRQQGQSEEVAPTSLAQIRESKKRQEMHQRQQFRQNHHQQQMHGHPGNSHQPNPQQRVQHHSQHQIPNSGQRVQPAGQQRPSSSHPTHHAVQKQPVPAPANAAVAPPAPGHGLTERQLAQRKKEQSFHAFSKILIRYLAQKDPEMHRKAQQIYEECRRNHINKVPGFESLTDAMRGRLRQLVGEAYWKKGTEYLVLYMKKQKEEKLIAQQASVEAARRKQIQNLTPEQQVQYQRQKQLQQQQKQQQQQLQAKQQPKQQHSKSGRQPSQKAQSQQAAANSARPASTRPLDSIIQDIHKKKEQLSSAVPTSQKAATAPGRSSSKSSAAVKGKGTSKGVASAPSLTAEKGKGVKKVVRRRSASSTASRKSSVSSNKEGVSLSSTAPSASAAVPPSLPKATRSPSLTSMKEEPPPKEYQELMSMIENAVEYDWPSALDLVTDKEVLDLSEEDRKFLIDASILPLPDAVPRLDKNDVNKQTAHAGWSQKNVLSARAAWARIRLYENKKLQADAAHTAPTVGDGMLTLPTATGTAASASNEPDADSQSHGTDGNQSNALPAKLAWVNEEVAEQDKTLELLSQGTQLYIKGLLEKTIQCARQRQNIDGIRLWHQQYVSLPTASKGNSALAKVDSGYQKPPLTLQLGCDVSRQVAWFQGNAAMTCKRMEEALQREPDAPSGSGTLDNQSLSESSSMGDASLTPRLKLGVEKADLQAKRDFEVYGGRHARDRPFGNVPKRAKIQVFDFMMGSQILPGNSHYHTASDASGRISF